MKRSYTRADFHELVWSTPSGEIADEMGVTVYVLSKLCQRHLIPFPSPRYWTGIADGKPPKVTPLLPVDNEDLQIIDLNASHLSRSAYAAKIVAAAALASNGSGPPLPRKPLRPALEKPEVAKREPSPPPERFLAPIAKMHPIIKEFDRDLRASSLNHAGELNLGETGIHPSNRPRLAVLLHFLASDLQNEGIDLRRDDQRLVFFSGPDSTRIYCKEQRTRTKHEPTSAELRALENARRSREWGRWPSIPDYDYEHSGKLTIEIGGWGGNLRGRWSDGKHQTLERIFDSIKSGIVARIDHEREDRLERERRHRAWEHYQHRQKLQKGRIEREEKRIAFLKQLAEFQREAADLRVTISQMASGSSSHTEYDRMLLWANNRLAHLENLQAVEAVTARLRADKLFPEVDDLYDAEGDVAVR